MITISVDFKGKEPLYEQIYKYIREEITSGAMPCGSKLPSGRGLASNLGVSRNTVDMAYGQLVSEGYIESIPQKGYYVCDLQSLYEEGIYVSKGEEETVQEEDGEESFSGIDFSLRGVDMNYFPYDKWRKLMRDCLIDDNKELFLSGNHQGDIELRTALRDYIHQSRGVKCRLSQIVIGAGTDYMMLLLTHILQDVQHVAVENPVYKPAYTIFKSVGYEVTPVKVDEQGMDVEELRKSDANIAYVTPSHQFPQGMVMSVNRRQNLLAWAKEKEDRYIIEDDYDSEFRYYGKPIPTLQSQDPFEKVIYMGTLSKVIAPGIRISFMVLPKSLEEQYRKTARIYYSTVSRIDQRVLAQFFHEGYFERHLNKMRKVYKNKHDLLLQELKKSELPVTISGENAGLHVLLHFGQERMDADEVEERLVALAEQNGVRIYALSSFYIGRQPHVPTVLIGYARLNQKQIKEGVHRLLDCFGNL